MKVLAITQARYGSTRLPAKILKEVNGKTLLEIHLTRLKSSKLITKLKVATTNEDGSKYIIDIAHKLGIETYQGSVDDVLDRFYQTARNENPQYVVRVTSDCPLIDSSLIDKAIQKCIDEDCDYLSIDGKSFPDGMDCEVFKFSVLQKAWNEAKLQSEREHVTPYIWKNGTIRGGNLFKTDKLFNDLDWSKYRITVDTIEDFSLVKHLIENLGTDKTCKDYVEYLENNPNVMDLNSMYERNEGYTKSITNDKKLDIMGKGQALYEKAKKIIPGGTMLLSKRPEQFLPQKWPAYFSKAKGCKVWDLDGREYTDCTIMGIGTNTLGYGRDEVDEAVSKVIRDGNMSTLNCPEEVELAEKLIQMDSPWAEMVRFARTGGEINAITVRLARAATGKDKIAICGYHGWHDWYLSVNLAEDDALSGHLLPGLEPAGVPKGLQGTTLPFHYNNFDELLDIVNKNQNDLAAIKMEVCRNNGPENDFLQRIRQLCDERGIILIFDECTSGFRETFGGLHKKYGVTPDMAIYSKTLGNGYAISAVVGRRWIMDAADGKTWISSTFWTERIGPTAALATLKVMEQEKSWEKITAIGKENKRRWQNLADKYGLSIRQWGIPALAGYTFNSPNALAYKTYITQEMLKKGYLVGNSIYACLAHTPEIMDGFFYEMDRMFATIREFEDGRDVMKELDGPVCQTGFKRLN